MNDDRDDCPTFDCDNELLGQTTVTLAIDQEPRDPAASEPERDRRSQALLQLDHEWNEERARHIASRRYGFPFRKSGVPNGLYLACDGAVHGALVWILGFELIGHGARVAAILWWAGLAVLALLVGNFLVKAARYARYQQAWHRYLRRRQALVRWDGRAESRPADLAR